MLKLIASDIDGTLLPEGGKTLNPEIYDIILELKKHHIQFVAASGRQLSSMQLLFAPIADQISYICENGAICMHEGQLYITCEFERDFATRIIEKVEKMPNCKLAISTPKTQYIKSGDPDFYEYMSKHLNYHTTPIDSFQDIKEPIIKLAFWNSVNNEESLLHARSIFEKEIRVVTSGNQWIDFIPFHANKGTALKFLLEKINLTPDEAISFGDQQNDIEMLDYTKTSYVMAHSKPEIQAHATHITDSVAKTLRELLKTLG